MEEKRNLSVTLYVRRKEEGQKTKQTHDRILWEDHHLDRKKNFFEQLRKE